MTAAKLAISLPEEQLALARAAVREGRAASVSAFIAAAIERQGKAEALEALVRDLITEHGEPTARDKAWAARVLARRKRR